MTVALLALLAGLMPTDGVFNDNAHLNPGQVIITRPHPAPPCHREGRAIYCDMETNRD